MFVSFIQADTEMCLQSLLVENHAKLSARTTAVRAALAEEMTLGRDYFCRQMPTQSECYHHKHTEHTYSSISNSYGSNAKKHIYQQYSHRIIPEYRRVTTEGTSSKHCSKFFCLKYCVLNTVKNMQSIICNFQQVQCLDCFEEEIPYTKHA